MNPRRWLLLGLLATALTACGQPDTLSINDFETAGDLERLTWRCPYWLEPSTALVVSGKSGLAIDFPAGIYPTLELRTVPADWRGYRYLEADLWAPDPAARELMIRIDDAGDCDAFINRFEASEPLSGRPQHLRILLERIAAGNGGRTLDLAHIKRILFYFKQTDRRITWYLDGVRLTR
ncbi:MAG: hypothetical protein GX444_15335 [Myxococcales bacterium]|nr:hypothetical protein [Myxococcales bacterium]